MSQADPPLFYRRHVFCCVNTRAPGHPRGCCSAKDSVKLRAHMKARAKQRGLATCASTRANVSIAANSGRPW